MGYVKDELIIESRYKVIKKIAKLGAATTYKVKDIRTRNDYIIKLFHGLEIGDIYKRFSPEDMEKTVSLNFMNITDFIDFSVHKGRLFFVREAFSETALGNIKFSAITMEQFYSILSQMLAAISFLDSQNFNATNLKISNFLYKMVNKKIFVKLTDYFYLGNTRKTKTYHTDYLYIAPETISQNVTDLVSNFYSIGIILYKIISGVFPYTAEDINSYINNKTLKLVKPLSEINGRISSKLSDFILNMIKLNPEDRFQSMQEVVKELNEIQEIDFSYLAKLDLKNYVNYHDYFVDEDISHRLVNHIDNISKNDVENIIVLHGQKGVRKDRTISLFRYHILDKNYLIFDYHCSKNNTDPFYSLCVEFFNANLIDKKEWEKAEPEISDSFRLFLTKSDKEIITKESDDKIKNDFLYVAKFLMFVAKKDRPLIFVIRNAELLKEITIKFLNFLMEYETEAGSFSTSSILIVLSTNNINKYYALKQSCVQFIHANTMDYNQTTQYISRLLKNQKPPENLLAKLWYYSHGNPWYIKSIILHLIRNEIITESGDEIRIKKITEIEVPKEIKNNLDYRLNNLDKKQKHNLEKLVWLGVKFTKNMFSVLIDRDYEIFFTIMQDNDFIEEINENIYRIIPDYLYKYLKDRLDIYERKLISTEYLKFVSQDKSSIKPAFNFILRHCNISDDYLTIKKVLFGYAKEFIDEENLDEYLNVLFEIYKNTPKLKEYENEKKEVGLNIVLNYEYVYQTRLLKAIKDYFNTEDDNVCKYFINSLYYLKADNFDKSAENLSKAYQLAKSPQELYVVQLIGGFLLNRMGKNSKQIRHKMGFELKNNLPSEILLEKIEGEFKNYFILKYYKLKILQLIDEGENFEATQLIEKVFSEFKNINNHLENFTLIDFYNFLGIIYSDFKRNEDAIQEYKKALEIAERYKILYYIMLLKNNIADTYLLMGEPQKALDYIRNLSKVCDRNICFNLKIQLLVNIAEALIKIGDFEQALVSLDNAMQISKSLANKPFLKNILHNYSLIKIKIKNFSYYLNHIKRYFPELLKGKITQINPTVKTYFYFLNQIGNYDEIQNLLENNKEAFSENEEFYYRAKSFLVFNELKNNLESQKLRNETLRLLNKTIERSKNINSKYAETITLINMSEAYLLLGDLDKAESTNLKAQMICREKDYIYWLNQARLVKVLIDLQNPDKNIYSIFSELLNINDYFVSNNIFYGNILSLYIAINILYAIGKKEIAKIYFRKLYLASIKNALNGLNNDCSAYFIKKFPNKFSTLIKNSRVKIAARDFKDLSKLLYDFSYLLDNEDAESREVKIKAFLKEYASFHSYSIFKVDNKFQLIPIISENIKSNIQIDTFFKRQINKALDDYEVMFYDTKSYHITIIPLKSGGESFGVMFVYEDINYFILSDDDKKRLLFLGGQIAFYFIYYGKYFQVNKTRKNVTKILNTFKDLTESADIKEFEKNLLIKLSLILNANRAFLFKEGKEIIYHIQTEYMKEEDAHKNINLSEIEAVSQKQGNFYKYETKKNYYEERSTFILKLNLDKVGYKGTYYFDNFNQESKLEEFDDEFIKMIIDVIRTALGIVKRNLIFKQLKKEIESFQKEKVFFIKLFNHEINTPLTSINYAKDNLIAKIEKEISEKKEIFSADFERIEENINRLHYLLQMFNKFYKYKYDYKPKYDSVRLNILIDKMLEEFKQKVENANRKIFFEKTIESNLPEYLPIDKEAVKEIYSILISNSVKYSPDGKKIIVGARFARHDNELITKDTLVLYVTDFGKGIEASLKDKIFEIVYEGKDINRHKSGKDLDYNTGALGLGLAIAKEIVKKLGGIIEYESKPGIETTFYVRIPLYLEKE